MKEYTIATAIAVILTVVLDRLLAVRLLSRKEFWIFLAVMEGFSILVNGYLTGRPIVLYGSPFFLGIRLGTIPLEDFFYGFSFIGMTLIFWEYFRRRGSRQ